MSDRTGLAEKVATRIAGFSKADYEEGCEPMLAMSAAEWIEILSALRQSQSPDRDAGEGMREACLAICASWEDPPASVKALIRPEHLETAQATASGIASAIRALSPEGKPSC